MTEYDTFDGISKKKFCMTCWHKIYDVWKGKEWLKLDPDLINHVRHIRSMPFNMKEFEKNRK